MKITSEKDSSQQSKLLTYLGITFAFQFVGFIMTFVYSSYFNRTSTFAQTYVFRSADSPPIPLGFPRPLPFGNHFFGDYLWIYAEIKQNGLGGYFGVSQLFLLIATRLPYYLSLILLVCAAVLLLYTSARLLLHELGLPAQLTLLVGGVLFTQPVLLALDRGQIQLLLFALLLLGLTLSIKDGGNRTWGAILIAAAISMKLTPFFFLLLFVREGNRKELKLGLISLISFMLIPLAYLHSGLGAWRFALELFDSGNAGPSTYSSEEFFKGNLAYNNSFKLLSYHLSHTDSVLRNVGNFVYENYFLCAGILCIFLSCLIIQKSITQFESVLLMAVASSLLIPIASGYTTMFFILPIVVVLTDKDFRFHRMYIAYCCFIGAVLMPKQFALGFAPLQDTSITFSGILNPILSLMVVVIITLRALIMRRRFLTAHAGRIDSII